MYASLRHGTYLQVVFHGDVTKARFPINLSHCCHIFSWLCLRWLYLHILSVVSYTSPVSCVCVSIAIVQPMCANNRVHYSLKVVFVCIIMQTYLRILNVHIHACQVNSVERVSESKSILCAIYGAVFSAYPFLDDCEIAYFISLSIASSSSLSSSSSSHRKYM